MDDEPSLRRKARAKIAHAQIPRRPPMRMWGGPSGSVTCAICDQPVAHSEFAVTLLFEPTTAEVRGDVYHVHVRCLAAWEFERGA
jgi:hypothetical protein